MEKKGLKLLYMGIFSLIAFGMWTWLIQIVDVKPAGESGTEVGFATVNSWFHQLTGVHWNLYLITDWLGLIPVAVCLVFGCLGCVQLIKRKSLFKVDRDLVLLGIYYLTVIGCYLLFESLPLNYRPVLVDGRLEVSYPSSTTLLVLNVMPTLAFQANMRCKSTLLRRGILAFSAGFSAFMALGRLISGVHWITDILGSVLFSFSLFYIYKGIVLMHSKDDI